MSKSLHERLTGSCSKFEKRSELGRLPIASFIKTQVMMYFVRINTNNINPLIKESLIVNKSLHDEGFYTWYTLALNVFQEFFQNNIMFYFIIQIKF
jgi:aconitase A